MNQKYEKIFLLAMMIMALGLGINGCSDSDDPTDPTPGDGDDGDTTAPVLLTTDPDPGSTGLNINAEIVAYFSEPLDPATLNGNITINPGTVVDLILTDNEVQIVHNPFNPGDAISITFSEGITDTSGNHLAAAVTYQYYVETDEVQVIEHTPADGSTGILRNLPVSIKFNQSMNTASLESGITASIAGKTDLAFTIGGMGNSVYTMDFDEDLPAETEVTITIGTTCQSDDGFALETAVVFSFETSADIDDTPPALVGFEPASGSTVSGESIVLTLTFDSPIRDGSIQAIRADINTLVAFSLPGLLESWNEDYTVLTLLFSPDVAKGVTLTIQFGDFYDEQGNVNTTHPTWTVNTTGTADHYPVDERLTYLFQSSETGNKIEDYYYEEEYRNVWSSTDHFMHQEYDPEASAWNEWENMIRTATALQLNGFREMDEGTPIDVVFDHPVKFLNYPMVPATWSDNIDIVTGEGAMNVAFSAEVLSGEQELPYNMGGNKSLRVPDFLMGDKSSGPAIFFPACRTIVQNIEGSIDGTVAFTEADTLIYCPGFGLVRENGMESNSFEKEVRYSTSEIIDFEVPGR